MHAVQWGDGTQRLLHLIIAGASSIGSEFSKIIYEYDSVMLQPMIVKLVI